MGKIQRWLLGLPTWLLIPALVLSAGAIFMSVRLMRRGPGHLVLWLLDIGVLVVFWGTHFVLRSRDWTGPSRPEGGS